MAGFEDLEVWQRALALSADAYQFMLVGLNCHIAGM